MATKDDGQETWYCPNGCGKAFTGMPGEVQAMMTAHMRLSCPKAPK